MAEPCPHCDHVRSPAPPFKYLGYFSQTMRDRTGYMIADRYPDGDPVEITGYVCCEARGREKVSWPDLVFVGRVGVILENRNHMCLDPFDRRPLNGPPPTQEVPPERVNGTMQVKQVLVVRTRYPDGRGGFFKPRTGKLIAQGAHASMKVFFDRIPNPDATTLTIPLLKHEAEWVFGLFTKIVVGCGSENELLELHQKALAAQLPCALVQDAGLTEFGGAKTYTALAIGPASVEEIDPLTGHLGLL